MLELLIPNPRLVDFSNIFRELYIGVHANPELVVELIECVPTEGRLTELLGDSGTIV